MSSSSRDHAPTTTSGKGTLTLAALSAALLVSGCQAEPRSAYVQPVVYDRLIGSVFHACDFYGRAVYVRGSAGVFVVPDAPECALRGSAEGVAAPVDVTPPGGHQ